MVPMNKLLAGIEAKREAIVTGRPAAFEADLPAELEQPVAARLRRGGATTTSCAASGARTGRCGRRRGTPEVEDRLGWLTIADKLLEDLPTTCRRSPPTSAPPGFTDVVLLGMGGSSLAPEVFRRSAPPAAGALQAARARLDRAAGRSRRSADAIDLAKTLFIVSSKSGGTIEPNVAARVLPRRASPTPSHFVAITDPGTSLQALAEAEGFRRVFLGDPEIGGRYSALSNFGIVPAALAGVDVQAVLEGAAGRGRELRAAGGQLGAVARRRARRAGRAAGATSSRSSSTRR